MRNFPLFLLLALPALSNATNYYVATTGDDNNLGTQALPWRTVQHAEARLNAGDVAYIGDGDYRDQGRITVNRSGNTASGVIVLRAQNPKKAIVRGFDITGASYVQIHDFTIIDMDVGKPGVHIENASYCEIKGNTINYNTANGIWIDDNGNPTSVHHCVVDGNSFYRNAWAGIESHGRNHTIRQNIVEESIDHHPCDPDYPDDYDADGIRPFGSGHVIENNTITVTFGVNPGGFTPNTGCSIAALSNPNNDFTGTHAHPDCIQTWQGDGFEVMTDATIRGNVCHGTAYNPVTEGPSGFLTFEGGANNITIYNNIAEATFVAYIDGSSNLRVENNTFVDNDSMAPYGGLGFQLLHSPHSTFRNNVFAHFNGDSARFVSYDSGSKTGAVADYNCVYVVDGQPGTPIGANDVRQPVGGIQFVNEVARNYHLKPTSPCKDRGVTIPTITTDKDGITRPQGGAYDIGAYEVH